MAADPVLVVLLVGFGLDELSMNAVSIPVVKNIIRGLSASEARAVAEEALQLPTAREVSDFLAEKLREHSISPAPGDGESSRPAV
jgi:phosphotransferase system enzyme I (PtsI)